MRVRQGHKETSVLQDLQARQVQIQQSLDRLVQQVQQERMGRQAQQEPLVNQDLRERLALLEQMVQQGRQATLVRLDHKDRKE